MKKYTKGFKFRTVFRPGGLLNPRIATKAHDGSKELINGKAIPKWLIRGHKDGKVTEQIKPIFPGYVLIGTGQIEEVSQFIAEVKGVLRIFEK